MSPSIPTSTYGKFTKATEAGATEILVNNDDTIVATITSNNHETLSTNSSAPVLTPEPPLDDSNVKLSRKRWFVLFAMAIFGLSMAVSGDTASILRLLLKLIDLSQKELLYISQMFHYLTLVLVGPTAMFVDKFGIRATAHAAVGFFVLNGLFKTLLYFTQLPGWHANKMYYYLAANFFGTQTYVLFILLPLKVSETWFSVSERSVAWTILMVQADLGSLAASYFYPRLIKKLEDFKLLAYIYIVCAAITVISCVACVTRSEPEHPPSVRMAEASKDDKVPLLVNIKRMVRHRDILLHVVHGGIYGSILYSVGSLLQDILMSIGESAIFAGNYMSINALVAIFMLITMSGFVHKVDNMLLACKLGSFAQSALFIAHLASLRFSAPGWLIIAVSVCLTLCRSYTSPHFNNITAHMACGTVSQATIVGFSVTVGTVLLSLVQTSFAYLIQDVDHKKPDYNRSLEFLAIVLVVNEVIYQLCFQGKTAAKYANPQNQGLEGSENAAYEHHDHHQES